MYVKAVQLLGLQSEEPGTMNYCVLSVVCAEFIRFDAALNARLACSFLTSNTSSLPNLMVQKLPQCPIAAAIVARGAAEAACRMKGVLRGGDLGLMRLVVFHQGLDVS